MAKAKKLPSGSWRVRVSTGEKDETGKYKYESLTADTEKEANFLALEYDLKRKQKPADMTVSEAIEKYIKAKSNVLSPSTIRGYTDIRENNLKPLMYVKLNKLNNNIIQSAINDEALNHSPKTVKNIYGLLTAVLNVYAPDIRLKIRLPQSEKRIITLLNEKQISELLKAINGTSVEIPVLLAVWLGLRQSEICGLQWDSVDFENSVIVIKQAKVRDKNEQIVLKTTKTYSSTRIIRVPLFVMDKIKTLQRNGEFVVDINGNALYKRFKRILIKNKLPEIRFHDLRILNASIMLKLKVQDKYAMKRGGWSTPHTMKNIYQQLFDEEQIAVDNAVDNYFYGLL